MTKNRLVSIAFGLACGLLLLVYFQFAAKGRPVRKGAPVKEQAAAVTRPVQWETLKRKSADEGWGRNPFFRPDELRKPVPPIEVKTLPLSLPPKARPEPVTEVPGREVPMKLEMILTVDEKKMAILNGRPVGEGDTIGEEAVARIEADRVILQKNGKRRTIRLDPFLFPSEMEKGGPRG